MSVDKKISYKDQRLTKAQQKKAKAINSAGIKNYLSKQETVTVPKKWLSSPDHVVAELAYITPREQKILLDADLYGSLNGQPNRGPGGIMSLQGAGDGGGSENAGTGGNDGYGGGGGGGGGGSGNYVAPAPGVTLNPGTKTPDKDDKPKPKPKDVNNKDWIKDLTPVKFEPPKKQTEQEKIFEEVTKGTLSDLEEKENFIGDTIFGPTQKYTGGSSLFGGANKYGYTDQYTDPTKTNFGDTKPGYGGKIMGGLLGLATGIPFIGGAIGSAYDKGKGLFGPKEKDMSGYNSLGLGGTGQYGFGIPNFESGDGDYDMLGNKINEITGEITSPTGQSLGTIPGYPGGPGSDDGGITTIPTGEGGSDQYVNLIDQYVPDAPVIPNDAFSQRFKVKDEFRKAKGNDLVAEDKRIAEYIKNLYT